MSVRAIFPLLCLFLSSIAFSQNTVAPSDARVLSAHEQLSSPADAESPSTAGLSWNDWRTYRPSAALFGGVGLLRMATPDLGPRGVMRLSAAGEFFRSSDFPTLGATHRRAAADFAISLVPLEYLQIYFSYGAQASTNTLASPRLLQSLGGLTLGVTAGTQIGRGFYAGIDVRGQRFAGIGNTIFNHSSYGVAPTLMLTWDARQHSESLPLRATLGVGFGWQKLPAVAPSRAPRAAEDSALGAYRYNRWSTALGLEVPLPAVTPFVEYELAVPTGTGGGLLSPDGTTLSAMDAAPMRLGMGLKVTAVPRVTFLAAVEFGLNENVALGVPATPPYNVLLGASFDFALFRRTQARVFETIREVEVQKPPMASGVAVDAATQKPLSGVVVTALGAEQLPVATDSESGRFLTHPLPVGTVKLLAQKDGYKPLVVEMDAAPGKVQEVNFALEPLTPDGRFLISVMSNRKPILAHVMLKGPKDAEATTTESSSPVSIDAPAGHYEVNVAAEGFLAQTRDVQISEKAQMALNFHLVPEPKRRLATVKDNRIQVQQQIHFAPKQAVIMPKSFELLAEVVDVIVKNDIKKIRVEGHTDNRGSTKTNLRLSEARARAVADYLQKSGIDRSRIDIAGFGDSRPLAPNLTAKGRELNRRVDFIIVD